MFDLLRIAKADPELRGIPFLCFRDIDSQLAPLMIEALRIACTALGTGAFIDLFQLKSDLGMSEATAHFRALLMGQLDLGNV
jgi:hypothetical protein